VQGVSVRLAVGRRGGVAAQQKLQVCGVGELGGRAEAAVGRVEALAQLTQRAAQRLVAQDRAVCVSGRVEGAEGLAQGLALRGDGILLFPEGPLDGDEQVAKRGQAMPGLPGKVGSGEEGDVPVGCQEYGQRPAAGTLGQELMRGLVDL